MDSRHRLWRRCWRTPPVLSAIELAASRWKPDCSLPDHPEVFVVGDMMNCNNLPGVAEVALQSGLHAAHVIRNRVRNGAEPTPWKYWDLGSMAAVDRRSAVLSAHGVRLSGRIAWLVWLVVHITFMTGFKNRFTALIHWFLSFVGTGRFERAIVVNLNQLLTHDSGLNDALARQRGRAREPTALHQDGNAGASHLDKHTIAPLSMPGSAISRVPCYSSRLWRFMPIGWLAAGNAVLDFIQSK